VRLLGFFLEKNLILVVPSCYRREQLYDSSSSRSIFQHMFVDLSQGTSIVVDGGITAAYITPLGETKIPPPQSLVD